MVMDLHEHSLILEISLLMQGIPQYPLIDADNNKDSIKYVVVLDQKALCHRWESTLVYAHLEGVYQPRM